MIPMTDTNPLSDQINQWINDGRPFGDPAPKEDSDFCGVTLMVGVTIDTDTIKKAFPDAADEILEVLRNCDSSTFREWFEAALNDSSPFADNYRPELLGIGVTHENDRNKFHTINDGSRQLLEMTEDEALEAVKGMARKLANRLGTTAAGESFPIATHTKPTDKWGKLN